MNKKIDAILEHIHNVEKNCIKLGKKLIELGKFDEGLGLIRAGRQHDFSKLETYEFENLDKNSVYFETALRHHHKHNKHHPESWDNSIRDMPDIFVAEMICDCSARAAEFGTDIRTWFEQAATKKYNFEMDEPVGRKINYYLDLLLDPPFK